MWGVMRQLSWDYHGKNNKNVEYKTQKCNEKMKENRRESKNKQND